MHIEILVEDSSGARLLNILLPQLLGQQGEPHSWCLHSYKGIGRVPIGLTTKANPAHRILLAQLPKLLRGYVNSPSVDAVIVVLDSDRRDTTELLSELNAVAQKCYAKDKTYFHLATEEIEAWYLGDREALLAAYPRAKVAILDHYVQDSVCDTWELMADALHPGGSKAVKKVGHPLAGQIKHEWAAKIGPLMSLDQNLSPSFAALRDGLRRLAL